MSPSNRIPAFLKALRPHQWVKNLLVFGGLIFAGQLLQNAQLLASIGAFAAFCAISSAVYLLNDLCDYKADQKHPVKRFRPIASGRLSKPTATAMMILLFGGGLWFSWYLRPVFAALIAFYLLLNIAYSFKLKRLEIIDVLVVASGFVFRAVGGCIVIGLRPSPWLMLCTFLLALLVCAGKRRSDLNFKSEPDEQPRRTPQYTREFLDLLVAMTGSAAIVTYSLYTMAEETIIRFGSRQLVLTVPFVIYGISRYIYLILCRQEGGDPARVFITDRPTMINVFVWIGTLIILIYLPDDWKPWAQEPISDLISESIRELREK